LFFFKPLPNIGFLVIIKTEGAILLSCNGNRIDFLICISFLVNGLNILFSDFVLLVGFLLTINFFIDSMEELDIIYFTYIFYKEYSKYYYCENYFSEIVLFDDVQHKQSRKLKHIFLEVETPQIEHG